MIFPLRVAPALRSQRNAEWQALVDRISSPDADRLDQMAFVLMMVRMNNCLTCNADSFRAMRGCTQCARQSVRRFRGEDRDLIAQFEQSRADVEKHLNKA
ncbi:MAG TPA: hypothetical protein GYA06_12310 [Chloroflexi bacterium]|nr:hypothetical protein [Chloroflexota bacterium]HPO59706.1 hypothetical protein [Anaerolineaceae bacterium]